jgi:pyruvate/2-oxoacid:ferredoxin oxidoreductase beta subunit
VRKALEAEGPSLIHVLTPCPKGWFFDPKHTFQMSRLAVETGAWALWEYKNGEFSLTHRPTRRKHVREYIRMQGRFSHLTDTQIDMIDNRVAQDWDRWEESDKQKKLILPWTGVVPSS